MNDTIHWLEPWDPIQKDPKYFEKELLKEIGKQHILYGVKAQAIGRRADCDEILFELHHSAYKYAVVHLTYSSKKEENPIYPRTKLYHSMEHWINDCMVVNHKMYNE